MMESSTETLFGIPADVMGANPPPVDIPIPTGPEQPAIVPETPPMDPVEESAMKFTKLLPYVKLLGSAMPSQKGLVRVMYALAEFPLGKEKPRLLTEGERQLFHVLSELQGYKSTVIQAILQKNMETEELKRAAIAQAEANPKTGELEV